MNAFYFRVWFEWAVLKWLFFMWRCVNSEWTKYFHVTSSKVLYFQDFNCSSTYYLFHCFHFQLIEIKIRMIHVMCWYWFLTECFTLSCLLCGPIQNNNDIDRNQTPPHFSQHNWHWGHSCVHDQVIWGNYLKFFLCVWYLLVSEGWFVCDGNYYLFTQIPSMCVCVLVQLIGCVECNMS